MVGYTIMHASTTASNERIQRRDLGIFVFIHWMGCCLVQITFLFAQKLMEINDGLRTKYRRLDWVSTCLFDGGLSLSGLDSGSENLRVEKQGERNTSFSRAECLCVEKIGQAVDGLGSMYKEQEQATSWW